ncbi:hypothetical protein M405DRAFT_817103, partial [Rhizopogon salebrosus TDB-379]
MPDRTAHKSDADPCPTLILYKFCSCITFMLLSRQLKVYLHTMHVLKSSSLDATIISNALLVLS